MVGIILEISNPNQEAAELEFRFRSDYQIVVIKVCGDEGLYQYGGSENSQVIYNSKFENNIHKS